MPALIFAIWYKHNKSFCKKLSMPKQKIKMRIKSLSKLKHSNIISVKTNTFNMISNIKDNFNFFCKSLNFFVFSKSFL